MGIICLALWLLLNGIQGLGAHLNIPGQISAVLALLAGILLLVGR